jgi:hypothetical protein
VLLAVVVWGIVTHQNSGAALQTRDLSGRLQWRYGVLSPALHTVMVLPVVVAIGQAVGAAVGTQTRRSAVQDDAPDENPYAPSLG